jgi:hypothetical protein
MQRQYTLKTALPCLSAYTTRDMMVIQIYDTHALPRPRAWLCVICDWTRACGAQPMQVHVLLRNRVPGGVVAHAQELLQEEEEVKASDRGTAGTGRKILQGGRGNRGRALPVMVVQVSMQDHIG